MGTKRGKKQPKISPLKPQHTALADDGASAKQESKQPRAHSAAPLPPCRYRCPCRYGNGPRGGSYFTKGRTGQCGLIGAASVGYFGFQRGHLGAQKKPHCKYILRGHSWADFCVYVFPPRHSARPFHHIRSSIARLHPPHPPITQAPDALPPAARATSFAPSPGPSSLLPSSSPPAPPSAALA
jgi:hypothetical protein